MAGGTLGKDSLTDLAAGRAREIFNETGCSCQRTAISVHHEFFGLLPAQGLETRRTKARVECLFNDRNANRLSWP